MIINKSVKVPHGCKKWNAGCNTCPVKNGRPYDCSHNACVRQGTPHCMLFYEKDECAQWYDGCNACEIFDLKAKWYCTTRSCDAKAKPFCRIPRSEAGLKASDESRLSFAGVGLIGVILMCAVYLM